MSPIFFPMNDNKDTIAALNAIDSTIVQTHPKLSEDNKNRTSKFLGNLCVYLENVSSIPESYVTQTSSVIVDNGELKNTSTDNIMKN